MLRWLHWARSKRRMAPTRRVIHDATHGVGVNSCIKVLDQIRSPNAGDLRRAVQVLPSAFFVLTGDVARANRLVRVAKRDWKHQCCKTGIKGDDVIWVNCVGTFGVSSVAILAQVVRVCHCVGSSGLARVTAVPSDGILVFLLFSLLLRCAAAIPRLSCGLCCLADFELSTDVLVA